jgi:hypothetical protein
MSGATVAIGAGTAALGAGISSYAQNQALRKQDSAAAAGIVRQGALRQQANADVTKTITDRATNNAANLNDRKRALDEQYAAALQRAAPIQGGSIVSQPGGSKRYMAGVTGARTNVADFSRDLAARTAALDAPAATNLETQLRLGDTATKLGLLGDTSANEGNLTEMQVKAIQANPWLLAGGAALQGAGSAYAGKGVKMPPKYAGDMGGAGGDVGIG